MRKIGSERFGLVMITATLAVIAVIAWQLLTQRHHSRENAIKREGRNVIQLLSNLSYDVLLPDRRHSSILELLNSRQRNPDFAYAAVVDLDDQPLAVTSSGDIPIPQSPAADDNTLWATEREFTLPGDDRRLIEFRSPVISQGELVGYIRVGYFQPRRDFELQELPFFAGLALPIFLLAPLTYLLIRRELRPLRQANAKINEVLSKQHIHTSAARGPDDLNGFLEKFKVFLEKIDQRFGEMENENVTAHASSLVLSYQRRRIESALQALPDAIVIIDESGIITHANSKVVPLLGLSLESVIGTKPQDWCDNAEIIALLARYNSNVSRLQRSETVEFVPNENPTKTLLVSTYPLVSPKSVDSICGTLVVFHDKTQEILASAARDEFISHVAHELKSPLNVIHMYAESLLNEDGVSDQERVAAINVINDEVERLVALISNLLSITKIEAGSILLNRQRVKPLEFLQDTFNAVARSAGSQDTRFDLQLPRSLSAIHVDKDLLRIAINNLLTNAVKYNRAGGTVTLSAEETDEAIFFRVSDTGIGIDPEDQSKIFEKFYRSDDDAVRLRNGHGLGLSLAKEIIQLHHGEISLQSKPGEGSEFTIELKKTASILKQAI